MNEWLIIGPLAVIPREGARQVVHAGERIALFRTLDDHVFALQDHCPHKQGPLSQGIVHGHQVACPLHGWTISLQDGQAQAPDCGAVACYPARVRDGQVEIEWQALGKRNPETDAPVTDPA